MIANGREDQFLPALIPRFQVCSLREKQLDQADVSLSGSQDQRPVVKTIARFDRRAALDQKLRSIALPQFASMMERSSTIFVRFVQGLAPVFKDFATRQVSPRTQAVRSNSFAERSLPYLLT